MVLPPHLQPHTSRSPLAHIRDAVVWCGRTTLVVILAIGMNLTGFAFLADTALAYYTDYEHSGGNTFSASLLDFSITHNELDTYIGLEADGDIDDFSSIVQPAPDSLPIQYTVEAAVIDGNESFCTAIEHEIEHGSFEYEDSDGLLIDLYHPTTTAMGTWEFEEFDLHESAPNYPHGTICEIDLIFSGWRSDISSPSESGYTDEERIKLRFKNRMIVMNEFLPDPDESAHGFDFGTDSSDKPKGEWVELYNNSDHDTDLSGWSVRDDDGHVTQITASSTIPETTVIPAHGWLVVYFDTQTLNNSGDVIVLEDASGDIVDQYEYSSADSCEKAPSPNATNTQSAAGNCTAVPPNKSYARIPDGTGAWVDPIPTPGGQNVKEDVVELEFAPTVMGTSTEDTNTTTNQGTSTATTTDTTAHSSTSTASDTSDTHENETGTSTAENSSTGTTTASSTSSGTSDDTDTTSGTSTPPESTDSSTTTETGVSTSTQNETSTDQGTSTPEADTNADEGHGTSTKATSTESQNDNDSIDETESEDDEPKEENSATENDPVETEEKASSQPRDEKENDGEEGDSNENDSSDTPDKDKKEDGDNTEDAETDNTDNENDEDTGDDEAAEEGEDADSASENNETDNEDE